MSISGKKIAIIVADGFESSEYALPKRAVEIAGATTTTISIREGEVRSWSDKNWSEPINAELAISAATARDYDALILPGGVMSPDILRQDRRVIEFIKEIYDAGKPIAAICHGLWPLIDADVVSGKNLTSYKSLRRDLENAGANWTDESVVVDNGLVTSRCPDDLPQFCSKLIEEVAEGIHPRSDAIEGVGWEGGQ